MSPRGAAFNASLRAAATTSILASARDLFERRGFESVTTAEIARHARVSRALVFKYYPTKYDLLAALIREHVQAVTDDLLNQPIPRDRRARLRAAVERFVHHCMAVRASHALYLSLLLQPETRKILAASPFDPRPAGNALYVLLARLVSDAGSKDPSRDLFLLLTIVNGAVATHGIQPRKKRPSARVIAQAALRAIAL